MESEETCDANFRPLQVVKRAKISVITTDKLKKNYEKWISNNKDKFYNCFVNPVDSESVVNFTIAKLCDNDKTKIDEWKLSDCEFWEKVESLRTSLNSMKDPEKPSDFISLLEFQVKEINITDIVLFLTWRTESKTDFFIF
jgi:hypothetical protein